MELNQHMRVDACVIGAERAPLLVVDDFLADPDELLRIACREKFAEQSRYYPGIRASAPATYQQAFAGPLREIIAGHFGVGSGAPRFSLCHFSLVTTPPERLLVPQRIPHVDSLPRSGLASIHYLFRKDFGGTAFYRHRNTGFEYIDEARNEAYLLALRAEQLRSDTTGDGYINGDTALYEQIARRDGVFNRLLVYRRNSLHSGCIGRDFIPDPDPATGRLSINCFIDFQAP